MEEIISFKVEEEFSNKRLDQFLALVYPEYSRSFYQNLIEKGLILLDNSPVKKPSTKVKTGQEFTIIMPPPEPLEIEPENIPLEIYYEDEDLAVVYKPPGMVVHPSVGHTSGTLVNALLYHFKNVSQYQGKERAGIVHRLDKDTAGLLIVAKSEFAHKELQKMFQDREIDKKYKAIVSGIVKKDHGLIDLPIGRSIYNRQKMGTVATNPKDALTEYWAEKRFEKHNLTLVDIKLHTGRTHQIRVHFSVIGHPLFNDFVYGFKKSNLSSDLAKNLSDKLNYHALVAYKLTFRHPRTNQILSIELKSLLKEIEEILQELSK
jgi:23S rRNA pseudouridine1911/1915/1917 synthase